MIAFMLSLFYNKDRNKSTACLFNWTWKLKEEKAMAYIEMKHSYKRYQMGDTEIIANNDISFDIEKGELVIILGASGAGKSTILNILGGMDSNDEGDVLIDGQNIAHYNAHQLTDYRRNDVGFVFQFYNLVPNLTALENVELASEIVQDAQDAAKALAAVGLGNRLHNFLLRVPWQKILKFCFVMNQQEHWNIKQVSKYCKSFKICRESREQQSLS